MKMTREYIIIEDTFPRAAYGRRSYSINTRKNGISHYYEGITPAAAREILSNPEKYGKPDTIIDDDTSELYEMDNLPRSIRPLCK